MEFSITMVLKVIFLILAAACNALMDTLQHHFSTSIFKSKDEKFWNPNVSWQYVTFLPYTKYRADAWHLAKSSMIIFLCFAIDFSWKGLILGILWNLTFNTFYNKIFIKK